MPRVKPLPLSGSAGTPSCKDQITVSAVLPAVASGDQYWLGSIDKKGGAADTLQVRWMERSGAHKYRFVGPKDRISPLSLILPDVSLEGPIASGPCKGYYNLPLLEHKRIVSELLRQHVALAEKVVSLEKQLQDMQEAVLLLPHFIQHNGQNAGPKKQRITVSALCKTSNVCVCVCLFVRLRNALAQALFVAFFADSASFPPVPEELESARSDARSYTL